MHLKILLPERILIDQPIRKVSAEAQNGSFTLLPRHIDFATALVPGLLSFVPEEGEEVFLAIDTGILVKKEEKVFVSTNNGIVGDDLASLHTTVEQKFRSLEGREKRARNALVRLETEFIRYLMENNRP
jgi:F-type H+-transporting ATPase subunit epsilon